MTSTPQGEEEGKGREGQMFDQRCRGSWQNWEEEEEEEEGRGNYRRTSELQTLSERGLFVSLKCLNSEIIKSFK